MIVAGIGCRRGASSADVEAAIQAALARAGVTADAVQALATGEAKAREPAIVAAAKKRGIGIVAVSAADLKRAASRSMTRSERVLALIGVPSLAETAALAAAGPSARLLGARLAVGGSTCALAASEASL